MAYNKKTIKDIKEAYFPVKKKITSRLNEFKRLFKNGTDETIFNELVFCLLTPQSKARSCWASVNDLLQGRKLYKANAVGLSKGLCKVRFKNNKARYIVEAREKFLTNNKVSIKRIISRFKDTREAREWLVHNVKGIGYKEASHFLRNIGKGRELAILDRHILKNLKLAGVISDIPPSISKKKYFEIEEKMAKFAKRIKIPLDRLDMVMWYKEAGEVFK